MENKSITISDDGDTGFNFEFQVERRTLDSNSISYLICDIIRGDFLTWL
jgi:hypothetical protein